mgnify:CR=1 FL=1
MKIVKGDITNISNSIEKALAYEISDTNELMNAITEYTNESQNILVGEVWEKEMNVLKGYLTILDKRREIANDFLSSMRNANGIMNNYVDGFPWDADKCDTDLIPELESRIASLRRQLEILLAQSRSTGVAVDVSDIMEKIQTFQEIVEYLKQMPSTDNDAYNKYSNISSSISNMRSKTNSINVSSIS